MSIEFSQRVGLELGADDLLAMITDQICGGYGSFKRMEASYISETEQGSYLIELTAKPGVAL